MPDRAGWVRLVQVVKSRGRWILAASLIAGLLGLAGALLRSAQYTATAVALIRPVTASQSATTTPIGLVPIGISGTIQDLGSTYAELAKSRIVAEEVVTSLKDALTPSARRGRKSSGRITQYRAAIKKALVGLRTAVLYKGPHAKTTPQTDLVQEIQDSISVYFKPKSSLVEIQVEHSDAELAAAVANKAAHYFVEHVREFNISEARLERQFLEQRIQLAMTELDAATEALRTHLRSQPGIFTDQGFLNLLTQYSALMQQVRDAGGVIEQQRARAASLRKALEGQADTVRGMYILKANPLLTQLKSTLVTLQAQLAEKKVEFGEKHPDVKLLQAQIAATERSIQQESATVLDQEEMRANPTQQTLLQNYLASEAELQSAIAQERTLSAKLKAFPVDLLSFADKQLESDQYRSRLAFTQQNVTFLRTQLETARIVEAKQVSEVRVIDPATVPLTPDGLPLVLYPLSALLLGFAASVGFVAFVEGKAGVVRDADGVEEELNLAVAGVVPLVGNGHGRISVLAPREGGVAALNMDEWPPLLAEAMRIIRTNLHFLAFDKSSGLLVVTSALAQEGKTFTSCSLATAFARSGARVLLVDADARRPGVHEQFGLKRAPGLTDLIVGTANPASVVQEAFENLHVMASGAAAPNPGELLGSPRAAQLLTSIKKNYDTVLIDTPPLLPFSETRYLASLADAVLLVLRCDASRWHDARRAKRVLDQLSVKNIWPILNAETPGRSYGYESYYYAGHYD